MPSFDVATPKQIVLEGMDAAQAVAESLSRLESRRAMFVVDRGAFRASGAEDRLQTVLRDRTIAVFEGFEINPKIEDVDRGVRIFRDLRPDAIVAVGGGSALDMAKLIAACGPQDASPRDCAMGSVSLVNCPLPIVAVPTTAGTGSEATHFAVVYVDGKKRSLADPRMRPSHAVLDPTLTYSLPRAATTASGLDSLCQAVESIWAVGATDASKKDARSSFELALRYLPTAANKPDSESRAAMLRAAHLSGRAIDVTKTTAPHACSYSLTTRYGTPHGIAVALTLGPFLRWNGAVSDEDCNDRRGAECVRQRIASIVACFGTESIEAACDAWEALLRELAVPTRLREIGVAVDDLPLLADDVNVERLANNPREIDRTELTELLRSVY